MPRFFNDLEFKHMVIDWIWLSSENIATSNAIYEEWYVNQSVVLSDTLAPNSLACNWRPVTIDIEREQNFYQVRHGANSASSSRCSPKLQRSQLRIHPTTAHQFIMFADLCNLPFVEHHDAVGFLDRG
jgi:hypothetical protein